MMRDPQELCDRVVAAVGDRAAAVVISGSNNEGLTRFANSHIHQNVASDGAYVSLRATVDGGRTAQASTSQIDDASIDRLIESTLAAARLRPEDASWPGLAPESPLLGRDHPDEDTIVAAPEARAAIVRDFVDAGAGLESAGFCSTRGGTLALATSSGQRVSCRMSKATVDGVQRTGTSDGFAHHSSPRVADLDGGATGTIAEQKARDGAAPMDLEPGHYEVILEPKAVSELLFYLSICGFNAKRYEEGTSYVHLGEQQMDTSIEMWDDATDERVAGPLFDGEGTPKHRVDLVRAGVTVGLAHDRRTAAAVRLESTGHHPGNDASGPYPENMFVGAGSASRGELVASVERGLLVTDFWYNRILDPKTQVITGLTRNGLFLIEHGEVTCAVKNFRFTQSIVAALGPGKVLGIGSDAQLIGGEYGFDFHVPSLHLADWSFTGGAKG